jgi:hypothetical protein
VVQDAGRIPAQPVGQLFVRQRLVQTKSKDAEPEHAGQGSALGIGRRPSGR